MLSSKRMIHFPPHINFQELYNMAVIYQITNMANNKYYIGSADSFARREWQHKYDLRRGVHKNPRLQAAWNKYGEEAFVFEILKEIPEGSSQLQVEETYLIQHVGSPSCYNINQHAELSRLGMKMTVASKQKLSKNRTGKAAGENHYRYGKKVAPEVREKIGAAQRGKSKAAGRKVTEAGRAKIRANIEAGRSHMHWLGREHTQEARLKMSRPVLAISPQGERTIFSSITALREMYDLAPPTVDRALKSGKSISRGKMAGWVFQYLDTK
jgi:group I intron endonuclease